MEKKIQQWEQKNYIDEETGEVVTTAEEKEIDLEGIRLVK